MVVEVIKVIGKRVRMLQMGKYDVCLNKHLSKLIEKSQHVHVATGSRGRGSLIALLFKTTTKSKV